jgi:hypothetical protein
MAMRDWGSAKPVARRGYYREIVAKFGYGHITSLFGITPSLGGQAGFERACVPCQHVTRGKGCQCCTLSPIHGHKNSNTGYGETIRQAN